MRSHCTGAVRPPHASETQKNNQVNTEHNEQKKNARIQRIKERIAWQIASERVPQQENVCVRAFLEQIKSKQHLDAAETRTHTDTHTHVRLRMNNKFKRLARPARRIETWPAQRPRRVVTVNKWASERQKKGVRARGCRKLRTIASVRRLIWKQYLAEHVPL